MSSRHPPQYNRKINNSSKYNHYNNQKRIRNLTARIHTIIEDYIETFQISFTTIITNGKSNPPRIVTNKKKNEDFIKKNLL